MKLLTVLFILTALVSVAAPFRPLPPEVGYGVGTMTWHFESNLSKDASGVIQLCYSEEGAPDRILGTVAVRPFQSSSSDMPELRILFSKAESEGKMKVVLVVGYGIRSGTFIHEVPGLTSHSLVSAGTPQPNDDGEYSLVGFGDGGMSSTPTGFVGAKGRLFFRYDERS